MTHELRLWPQFRLALLDRSKRYELRKDDRGFAVEDTLVLETWDPTTGDYVKWLNPLYFRVTSILRSGEMPGLEPGYVILGLGPA